MDSKVPPPSIVQRAGGRVRGRLGDRFGDATRSLLIGWTGLAVIIAVTSSLFAQVAFWPIPQTMLMTTGGGAEMTIAVLLGPWIGLLSFCTTATLFRSGSPLSVTVQSCVLGIWAQVTFRFFEQRRLGLPFRWEWDVEWLWTMVVTVWTAIAFAFAVRMILGLHLVAGRQAPASGPGDGEGLRPRPGRRVSLLDLLQWIFIAGIGFAVLRNGGVRQPWDVGQGILALLAAGMSGMRLASLSSRPSVRWAGRGLGLLLAAFFFAGFAIWIDSTRWESSIRQSVVVAAVGMLTAVLYWFATEVPILWLRACEWRVVDERDERPPSMRRLSPVQHDVIHESGSDAS